MVRGAWWATVHGFAKSQTELSAGAHTQNTVKEICPEEGSGVDGRARKVGAPSCKGGLPDNLPPGQAVKLTPALGPRCRWTGSSLAPQKVAQGQMLFKTNRRSESLTASSAFCQRQSLQIPGR